MFRKMINFIKRIISPAIRRLNILRITFKSFKDDTYMVTFLMSPVTHMVYFDRLLDLTAQEAKLFSMARYQDLTLTTGYGDPRWQGVAKHLELKLTEAYPGYRWPVGYIISCKPAKPVPVTNHV